MDYKHIDGKTFLNMILAGVDKLNADKASIDSLNVFPVPDGDTGTNMSMTLNSVSRFVGQIPEGEITVAKVSEQMAYGALMGARGNSGVITSQILGGIAKVFQGLGNEATAKDFVDGFASGVESAYKAVVKPQEGTILTVCREASEYLTKVYQDSFTIEDCLNAYLEEGYRSLDRTPELLPVLKQAGVVDAGGKGLLTIVEGMLGGLTGKTDFVSSAKKEVHIENNYPEFHMDEGDINFQYCTELVVTSKEPVDVEAARAYLGELGDCVLVVGAGNITKVHVHTNHPGLVFEYFGQFGDMNSMKIDNMRDQSHQLGGGSGAEAASDVQEHKAIAVVAVSAGEGLNEIFSELGVAEVVTGGQTMNPSTEDFMNAIQHVNADQVILLPNNKNIIMAAEQAAKLSEVAAYVVPTRTIPQGISAMMAFNPEESGEANAESMGEAIKQVMSAEITYAVRDTSIDAFEIKEGQLLGIVEGKIKAVDSDMNQLMKDVLANMNPEDAGLITLYYGEDINEEQAGAMAEMLQDIYPDVDIEVYEGAQAVYYYFVSVE